MEANEEVKMQTKYCKFCGAKIPLDAVICLSCGRQVEILQGAQTQPQIVVNSTNTNANTSVVSTSRKPLNKWAAVALCFFIGYFGAHKFYEGKTGMGILYIFTGGLCGIGVIIDFIALLFKSNPYYV
jgi:restriction system protein